MKHFYILLDGNFAIVKARTITQARKYGLAEFGRYFFNGVRPATQEEVDWYLAFDGRIHDVKGT